MIYAILDSSHVVLSSAFKQRPARHLESKGIRVGYTSDRFIILFTFCADAHTHMPMFLAPCVHQSHFYANVDVAGMAVIDQTRTILST